MLEDCTMDKKTTGRSAQIPCKGNGTDSKKTQDASSSKTFARGPRKRETNATGTSKYDQNRKPQPQKSKAFDKRPQHRGHHNGGGKENSKVEDQRAELESVLSPGSKKVNLNHLLNFHYTPKESQYAHGRGGPGNVSGRWSYHTQRHKYNKEQFLQANCQFVVKAEGDYSRYTKDPDTLVQWELIEQIMVQSLELLSCPICLSTPTAARMTRCGHVFCWPCMLHYLALADKTWRKCPICYEAVHRDDLKSVVVLCHAELSVGDTVTLKLMRREKGSLVAVPVEQCEKYNHQTISQGPMSMAEKSMSTLYCKLLLATPLQVLEILERERKELEERLKEEESTPEICFTEQALELLTERKASLLGQPEKNSEEVTCPVTPSIAEAAGLPGLHSAFDNTEAKLEEKAVDAKEDRPRNISTSSEGQESEDGQIATAINEEYQELITVEDLETPSMLHQANCEVSNSKHFYFYQAADGQHMYLHAMNVRMLECTYSNLESSPLTLKGRIVEKESGSMNLELRRRLRYLQHLPVTCQFEVVELDLRPPIVSKETLQNFQEQLEQRRKKRQRKAREDKRREKKILEEENLRLGLYPIPDISLESYRQFPECGIDNSALMQNQFPNMGTEEQGSSPPQAALEDLHLDQSGPSFAQMLREGQGRPVFPPASRSQAGPRPARRHSDSEPEPDGYVPAPSFMQNFGDALAQALERASSNTEGAPEGVTSGRKKKKPKQKVLFSTGMACNSKQNN